MANIVTLPFDRGAYGYTFGAMGTSCTLRIVAASPAAADMAAATAVAEVERIEKKYSRYAPSSTLSTLNRSAGGGAVVTVDEETAGLLDFGFACHKKSGGLFDITAGILRRAWDFSSGRLPTEADVDALLPMIGMDKLMWDPPHLSFSVSGMELDLGGIGKEYAVDRVAAELLAEGITEGLIDLGGDLLVLGPHPDGEPWQVGLRDPRNPGLSMGEVAVVRGALATSGDYERCLVIDEQRYCHILNPRTGWPVRGLVSVTAHAPQCMVAGSVTTIAMLMGREGIAWLADLGLPHRWVDDNGRQGGNLPPVLSC